MGNVSKRKKKVKQGNRQLLKILMPYKKRETGENKTGGPEKDPGKAALVRACNKRNDHKQEI